MYLDVNCSSDGGSFNNLGVIYDEIFVIYGFSCIFGGKSMIICLLGLGSGYFLTWWDHISHMHVPGCELLIV